MNLKNGDKIKSAFFVNSNSWYLLTQRAFIKRVKTDDIPATSRANRGLQVLRTLKTNNHTVFAAGLINSTADLSALTEELDLFSQAKAPATKETDEQVLEVISETGKKYDINLCDLSLSDRTSNGHPIADDLEKNCKRKNKIKKSALADFLLSSTNNITKECRIK